MTFKIEFQVVCETRYGQQAVICGNLPQLGNWNCKKALDLLTDERSFPLWKSARPLFVRENTTIEFKLCILTASGQLVKWEQIGPNRIFTPKSSLIIHFNQSEVGETFKVPRRKPSSIALGVQNVRKGTEDVINDLASDSSSNRQMWKEHRFNEQEQSSLLLSQFADNLKKAVGTQRQQMISPLQLQPEMQLQNQMQIGTFEQHQSRTHYIFTDMALDQHHLHHLRYHITEYEKIILLPSHNCLQFQIEKKEEVSVFHFFAIKNEDQKEVIEKVRTKWAALDSSFQRGVFILYSADSNLQNFQKIVDQKIDMLVCSDSLSAKRIANQAKNQGFKLKSSGKNQFVIFDGQKLVVKILLYGFQESDFIDDIENNIKTLDSLLFKGFYFKYHQKDLRKQFRNSLIQIHSARHECLIILQIKRIEDLSVKTIADILQLTSLKYQTVVIILAQQRFPKNLHSKIPAIKNRLLILNTEGEIYSNGKESIDLFDYLQVTKGKFQQSEKIIAQKIGKGLSTKRNSGTLRMSLQFEDDAFGNMLKERALRCIQDINKKSLAKVIPQQKNNILQLIPFALHPVFLLKVALATFTSRLRNDQKSIIISIESEGFAETKWMEPPQGRQINLQFCRFRLSHDKGKSYRCASLNQLQLNELLDVIAQLQDEKKKQGQSHQLIFDHAKSI